MTQLEYLLIVLLWIITGLFICHKERWYSDPKHYIEDEELAVVGCIATIIFAPIALVIVIINRVFVQPWYKDK